VIFRAYRILATHFIQEPSQPHQTSANFILAFVFTERLLYYEPVRDGK